MSAKMATNGIRTHARISLGRLLDCFDWVSKHCAGINARLPGDLIRSALQD